MTGATGGTGQLIYKTFVEMGLTTRALVTSQEKAKDILNCTLCDESEGIYVGDVTNASTLEPVMAGASFVAIAVGTSGSAATNVQMSVEWMGVENQVSMLATGAVASGRTPSTLGVALISSMGTTDPSPPSYAGGTDLFWKLQGETFLATSGVPFTIVKPCGLLNGDAGAAELLVGHDDVLLDTASIVANGFPSVTRADVARVIAKALTDASWRGAGLRFDLCSSPKGTPTPDSALDEVLRAAQWPWARSSR